MIQDILGIALIVVGLVSAFARGRGIAQPADSRYLTRPFSDPE